ncbi:MAG TPA: sigma-70 family RNA polymerase sigma factor [Aestuariivirga sp.]
MALRAGPEAPVTRWQSATDAALLEASARHVEPAFVVLIQRYQRDVYRLVWRISAGHADSEDIAQETFLRLWVNPAQVREAKALKGWLLRVASNMVMDRYRRKPMLNIEAAEDIADMAPGPDGWRELSQVSRAVDAAIAQLPDRQRMALALVHFEQMSNIAAAEVMELSVDALESLLARARRRLKEILGPEGREMILAVEKTK